MRGTTTGSAAIFLLLTVLGPSAPGGVAPAAAQAVAQSVARDSLDEGPHVYWRDNSTALVFYHCRGEFLASDWLQVRGTVAVKGLCGDSAASYTLSSRPPQVEPDVFDNVSSIFAVSDIHGEYDALVELLVGAGVLRDDLTWGWGSGHLVIAGDILDRGAKVTECLWLIHRLEREARAAGGRVHYLLGNHETMVMRGDLRYVHERYLKGVVNTSGVEYDDLFGPSMELGRWLRTRHVAVRLNGVVFVHGGLGPEVIRRGLSLKELNAQARAAIDLRSYDLAFNDMPGFLLASDGPLWFRRYHAGRSSEPQLTLEELTQVLDHFDASAVVVGHTDVGRIQALYGGKAYGVDVSLESLGGFEGLLLERGTFHRVGVDGVRELIGPGAGEDSSSMGSR